MRKYDIAYVPNGRTSYVPHKKVDDMSLEEIKRKYIKTCGKANGDVAVCSKCQTPCNEGKRAIQLLANTVYNDPPIPLYGGKTLIEKAREENLRRREEMKKKEAGEKEKKKRIVWDGWWEESLKSEDQIKWIMMNMGLSRTKAKNKIYQYKWYHGLTGNKGKTENTTTEEKEKEEMALKDSSLEEKLEQLMHEQEMHKKKMDEYMALYYKEKEEYDKYKEKSDILCRAMDILNG